MLDQGTVFQANLSQVDPGKFLDHFDGSGAQVNGMFLVVFEDFGNGPSLAHVGELLGE